MSKGIVTYYGREFEVRLVGVDSRGLLVGEYKDVKTGISSTSIQTACGNAERFEREQRRKAEALKLMNLPKPVKPTRSDPKGKYADDLFIEYQGLCVTELLNIRRENNSGRYRVWFVTEDGESRNCSDLGLSMLAPAWDTEEDRLYKVRRQNDAEFDKIEKLSTWWKVQPTKVTLDKELWMEYITYEIWGVEVTVESPLKVGRVEIQPVFTRHELAVKAVRKAGFFYQENDGYFFKTKADRDKYVELERDWREWKHDAPHPGHDFLRAFCEEMDEYKDALQLWKQGQALKHNRSVAQKAKKKK